MAFPQTPNVVTIELYYSGIWNDITQYVYHRDASPITITRGRQNEGQRCDPGKMTLTLNNRDGRFSPRNPNSPLFGLVGRNTPIRVKVTFNAVVYVRFTGEITSWPSRWDVSGKDVWVPIEAAGILRRLGQGSRPLRSAAARSTVAPGNLAPIAYWPMEDGENSTQFASALPDGTPATNGSINVVGGAPATYTNTIQFAANGLLLGSDPLPSFGKTTYVGSEVPSYADTGKWTSQMMFFLPADSTSGGAISEYWTGSATLPVTVVDVGISGDPRWVRAQVYQSDLTTVAATLQINFPVRDNVPGKWMSLVVGSVTANDLTMAVLDTDGNTLMSGTVAVGAGFHAILRRVFYRNMGVTLAGTSFGHSAVYTQTSWALATDGVRNAQAAGGFDGERAHVRFGRLCSQVSIPNSVTGDTSAQMGPERMVARLESLRDCEDVDQGFLFETRDSLGLKFRTNSSRYNQVPLPLHYNTGNISPPFDPEPDDFDVANDREVKRRSGSSARRELTAGPLSTQDPPAGVGRYDDSITVSAFDDDQLPHIANWRLHVGTWDSERYPRVRVDLSAASNASLIPLIAAADSGGLITIDNLPSWLPPETAELLIEGYTETIGFFDWDFVFNTSPAGPYNVVGVWDMTAVLHTSMNTSVTTADIATTAGPLLATSGLGSGYGITIGGENMQVTAVAASLITFGAIGAVSTGSSGSRTPGLPTGSASGNLILIFASTRNSGTGTVDTPASWVRLAIFPSSCNVQVFARIYDGVWTMPTVTFTGGSANEDTIAQSIRLAGKWHDASKVLVSAASCLNASAQDIQYPGLANPYLSDCIVIWLGWKQDDFTSVATIGSGPVEIEEASSIAGNDASQVWDYQVLGSSSSTAIGQGVFTVTGGAAAISRGAVAFLHCDYETATVTRSTNGVSASHSAGDAVVLTRPMRWAL